MKNAVHKSTHGTASFILNNGHPCETMNVVAGQSNCHLAQVLRDDTEQTPVLFDAFSKAVRNMPNAKLDVGPDVAEKVRKN